MLQYSSRQKFTSTGRRPPFPSSRAYDIRFGLGDYYGGLHCGDALEVFTGRKWKPTRIALAALLFGFCRALGNVYSGFDFLKALNLPAAMYNMLPYIISLVVLAFTSKKSRAPKAEGIPYDKGQR